MQEFLCSGTYLEGMEEEGKKLTSMELINHLNKGKYSFVIYDAFDDVHNREKLIMFELDEIESYIGVDKIFVMGHFNNVHKEILKLSDSIMQDIIGIETLN